MRQFVIGDIHGCSKALRTLLERISPTPDDELIFLGDYVDRGSDSRGVIDELIRLQDRSRVVALRGNHEIMLLGVLFGGRDPAGWLASGGHATVASYGGALSKMPPRHRDFFRRLRPYHETDSAIFVHAGYQPDGAIEHQDDALTYWTHLTYPLPAPHHSGKRVFVGHTPQRSGNVLDANHLICVDTFCFGGGYLSAMDLSTDELIQVDRHGHLRRPREITLASWMGRLRRLLARGWRHGRGADAEASRERDVPRSPLQNCQSMCQPQSRADVSARESA